MNDKQQAPRTTKVGIYLTVEINIDELEAEYGREYTTAEAKADAWNAMYSAAVTAAYPSDSNDRIISRVVKAEGSGKNS